MSAFLFCVMMADVWQVLEAFLSKYLKLVVKGKKRAQIKEKKHFLCPFIMLRDTKMNNFTKQATGLVACKSWGYINSDFNEKDSDLADSSQILRLCHWLGVCASCHLWSRTSRGWRDQVTVLNNPRCDSDVVLAGCRKKENIEGLDTHTGISFQIDPLDWPLTVWYLCFCQFKKENLFKNVL